MIARLAFAIFLFAASSASAHGGGLNAEGCHNDRRAGTYHCHRGPSRSPAPRQAPHRAAPPPQAIAAIPAPASNSPGRAPIVGAASVIDGDTIDIAGQRIRLWGIDAFEAAQRCQRGGGSVACGAQASHELSRIVQGQQVICIYRDTDRYSRTVAQCRVGEMDIGAHMVRAGLAVAFRRYALDYVPDEESAQAQQIGAWRGGFTAPTDYRAGEQNSVAVAQRGANPSDGACTIKGNINRRGERIYHLPSDPYYGRTNPEAMFCTEAEAQAAGFRRAGQPNR